MMRRIHCLAGLAAAGLVVAAGCSQAPAPPPAANPANVAPVVQPGAPGQPSTVLPKAAPVKASPHVSADTTFMQGMIHHHAQAIEMVDLLKTRTERNDMKLLGQKIEISQNDEIKMMKTWLTDRGEKLPMDHGRGQMMMDGAMMAPMPGMLSEAQMKALADAKGAAFDKLFLTGMIQHHEGALMMVADLFAVPGAAQDGILFDFASHVDTDQRMDLARMHAMLKDPK